VSPGRSQRRRCSSPLGSAAGSRRRIKESDAFRPSRKAFYFNCGRFPDRAGKQIWPKGGHCSLPWPVAKGQLCTALGRMNAAQRWQLRRFWLKPKRCLAPSWAAGGCWEQHKGAPPHTVGEVERKTRTVERSIRGSRRYYSRLSLKGNQKVSLPTYSRRGKSISPNLPDINPARVGALTGFRVDIGQLRGLR